MPTKKSRKVFRAKPVHKTRKTRSRKPQSAGGAWHTPNSSEGEIYADPADLGSTNSNSDCPNGIKLKNVECAYLFNDVNTANTELKENQPGKTYTFWGDQAGRIHKLKKGINGKIGEKTYYTAKQANADSDRQNPDNTITAPGSQTQEEPVHFGPLKESLRKYQRNSVLGNSVLANSVLGNSVLRNPVKKQTIKKSRRSSTKLNKACEPNTVEYRGISNSLSEPYDDKTTTQKKNRYNDIKPYKYNRVKIGKENEYINASYITIDFGADSDLPKKQYIATQCPIGDNEPKKDNTIADFWKMIWEQDTKVISMLVSPEEKTNSGNPKCTQYYPTSVGTSMTYGDITVEVTKKSEIGGIHITELRLIKVKRVFFRNKKETKLVTHLYYDNWPDKQTPSENDYTKIKKMSELIDKYSEGSTPVVHCSAGVGRTGTMIAINYLLKLLNLGLFECRLIFQTVVQLRQGRPHMVQTEDQYEYIFNFMNKAVSEKSK